MADKKAEKKKEYSAGNGKRWLIGLGVIVFIAIVIVAIVLLIPANTTSATDLLNKSTTTSFMLSQTEKENYNTFELKVKNTQKINKYLEVMPKEMADVETISIAVGKILQHYNEYIIFVENTKAYKQNYKQIKNGLNGMIESQKQLNEIIAETNKLSESSPTYLQNAWIEFREEYAEWIASAKDAINGLSLAYQGGLGSSTINNLASKIILDTTSDYVNVICQDIEKTVEEEKENPNRNEYTYKAQGKTLAFKNFVARYLNTDVEIKDYYFNDTHKTYFQKLNDFYTLYSQTNMASVIGSIEYLSDRAVVKLNFEGVEDAKGVYSTVKEFVLGGV